MKLIAGNSNTNLAFLISQSIGQPLVKANIGKFADGEIRIEINENIRGSDVFVIQSTSNPVNSNLMELLILIDALKRASAKRITAVIPYFGYARQDRKTASRSPISAKLVADLITTAGANRILTLDLHAGQIQGFFNIPVDTLIAQPIFIPDIKNSIKNKNLVFISPDAGGTERARSYAKKFNSKIAIIDKRRPNPGKSEIMHVIGNVENKECIIVDDIVDSGGTLCHAAEALFDRGALNVKAYITHGVLSKPIKKNIKNGFLSELVCTDTIKPVHEINIPKLRYVSVSSLIGKAIINIHNEQSISSILSIEND